MDLIPKQNVESVYVGVAGWTIPSHTKRSFPEHGTHLARYARVLNCVEINLSFYREHKSDTYARWAASVPDAFQFSVKLSRYFTQETRLKETGSRLRDVLQGIAALGPKWGVLLVQLPPSLEFNARDVDRFLSDLRQHTRDARIAIEPRHRSWGVTAAITLLAQHQVSKVLADPEPCPIPQTLRPQVERYLRYFRLHGAPIKYRSSYPDVVIDRIQDKLAHPLSPTETTWCTFDNTTFGHATENALQLRESILNSRNS